ncbi:MAG: AAA family ATPase [Vicingaceae bacterium]
MQQEKALAILKSGQNAFLTGSAGSGKTYILNQYINYLKDRKVQVAVTASTGIAATHMNGMTIHAWSGIGVKNSLTRRQLVSLKTKKYLAKHLEKAQVLIIDEISMLHKNQLEMVNQVLQFFKDNTKAFGGIQIVFCGDFFQLPPIGNMGEKSRDKFAFMSQAWNQANPCICYLTEQYRQSDQALNQILNEIRAGQISKVAYAKLMEAKHHELEANLEPTQLFTHNVDVDRINEEELAKIKGKLRTFKAESKGNEKLAASLSNSVLAPFELKLKIGAKVMFVRNNPEKGIVNGSLGEIIGFTDKGEPSVKLLNGKTITATEEEWSIQDEQGKKLASLKQIPLRLAWAITVHKSQGMTLEAAQVDLSKTFETGQGYVALSRLKALDNLVLQGFNQTALQIDKLAFKADLRFQELSKEADQHLAEKELEKQANAFVKNCGGLTDDEEIEKRKAKRKEGKLKKKIKKESSSTYDLTYHYLKLKMPLKKIAKERGLNEGTVAGHLIKIKKDHPEANLSHYKPKKSIVDQVEIAYQKQAKSDDLSLKGIYEDLGGKVSYQNIKLALAFIL